MENINSQIADLKFQIAGLEIKKRNLETDPIANSFSGKLAEYLHTKFCCSNHTDGCSWLYEIDRDGKISWSGYAHTEYLRAAADTIYYFKINGYRVG